MESEMELCQYQRTVEAERKKKKNRKHFHQNRRLPTQKFPTILKI